jgi:hypothetical protein
MPVGLGGSQSFSRPSGNITWAHRVMIDAHSVVDVGTASLALAGAHVARPVMLGEDVNGFSAPSRAILFELDQLFLKRALGEDKARSLISPQR